MTIAKAGEIAPGFCRATNEKKGSRDEAPENGAACLD
jgi:hypothetical protein